MQIYTTQIRFVFSAVLSVFLFLLDLLFRGLQTNKFSSGNILYFLTVKIFPRFVDMASEQKTSGLLCEQKLFLWKIPNFVEIRESKREVNEQEFKFVTSTDIKPLKWLCYLDARLEKDQRDWDGAIFLYTTLGDVPPQLTDCHARIVLEIGDKHQHYFTAGATWKKRNPDGKHRDLSSRMEDTMLTADGALEIRITVTVFNGELQNARLALLEAQYEKMFISNFRSQFRKNVWEAAGATTKIVARDNVEFCVDRAFLAARSPVFRAMFQPNTSEGKEGVVRVKDMDSKPLKVLVNFMQTAELTGNWKDEGVIEGLVYGAHKYMLEDLKTFLNRVLGLVCTMENCGKLAGLAKAFGMKKAEKQLFEYFRENLANDLDQVASFVEEATMAAMLMIPAGEEQQGNDEEPRPKKSKLNEKARD